MRQFIRRVMYESHINTDKTSVDTTPRKSLTFFNQWLIYLEKTWLAPSNRSTIEKLPSNVFLSEKFNIAIENFENNFNNDKK